MDKITKEEIGLMIGFLGSKGFGIISFTEGIDECIICGDLTSKTPRNTTTIIIRGSGRSFAVCDNCVEDYRQHTAEKKAKHMAQVQQEVRDFFRPPTVPQEESEVKVNNVTCKRCGTIHKPGRRIKDKMPQRCDGCNSDICPLCGATTTGVIIAGKYSHKKCDNTFCGWKGKFNGKN